MIILILFLLFKCRRFLSRVFRFMGTDHGTPLQAE
jgi:hypothetical protein